MPVNHNNLHLLSLTNKPLPYYYNNAGSLDHLLAYETERQRENVPTMAAVDGFNWLSSSSLTPLVLMRSIGFSMANAYQPVKVRTTMYIERHNKSVNYTPM